MTAFGRGFGSCLFVYDPVPLFILQKINRHFWYYNTLIAGEKHSKVESWR